jgi:transcriptional regulator GlxA family with amidase domain
MVCADGPAEHGRRRAGQSDLMLHLLRTRFGDALADVIGKVLLIDGRQAQAPFVVPAMLSNGNELIRRLTRRIESALPNATQRAPRWRAKFALSQRTLARHVRARPRAGCAGAGAKRAAEPRAAC